MLCTPHSFVSVQTAMLHCIYKTVVVGEIITSFNARRRGFSTASRPNDATFSRSKKLYNIRDRHTRTTNIIIISTKLVNGDSTSHQISFHPIQSRHFLAVHPSTCRPRAEAAQARSSPSASCCRVYQVSKNSRPQRRGCCRC